MAPEAGHLISDDRIGSVTVTRENIWFWLAGGLAAALTAVALALWAAYGPAVFINTLNTAWTCF